MTSMITPHKPHGRHPERPWRVCMLCPMVLWGMAGMQTKIHPWGPRLFSGWLDNYFSNTNRASASSSELGFSAWGRRSRTKPVVSTRGEVKYKRRTTSHVGNYTSQRKVWVNHHGQVIQRLTNILWSLCVLLLAAVRQARLWRIMLLCDITEWKGF